MGFAQIFGELMQQRNVTAYTIWKETKIPQSSIGRWKAEKAIPSSDNLQKLAEYFDVSVDYLLGKTDKKNRPTEYGEPKSREEELEFLNLYRSLPPEGKEALMYMLRQGKKNP